MGVLDVFNPASPVNPQIWIALLGGVCTIIVTITTWSFLTGRFAGAELQKAQQLARDLEYFKADIAHRFDQANEETSKAMSYIQGVESRCLREFANRELTDERFANMRRELDDLKRERSA